MQISQEEIEQYVQEFIHQAIRYEAGQVEGVRDLGESYAQVREVISTALLTDINVVFHLLGVGVREESKSVQEYLDIIGQIEDLLPSLSQQTKDSRVDNTMLAKIDNALTAAQLGGGSEVLSRFNRQVDEVSKKLASNLVLGEQLSVPVSEARFQISSLVSDLDERHDLLLQSVQTLLFGVETLKISSLFSGLHDRVLGAARSLLQEMRVERSPSSDDLARQSARKRFIQLQAAKVAIQQLTAEINPEAVRLQSGDVLFSVTGTAESPIEVVGSKSGGFNLPSDATVVVGVDGASPSTITLGQSDVPRLASKSPPNPPASTKALYFQVELDGHSLGPHSVTIGAPGYTRHGDLRVPGSTSAFVGFLCSLKYVGTLTAANEAAVRANESLVYKIVGFDNKSSLPDPIIKIDPPLPAGGFAGPVPLSGWELTLLPQMVRWEVPTSAGTFPNYLTRLVQQLSGPTDAAKRDAFQPWRPHTRITGTLSGTFLPGERVTKSNGSAGSKEGVVIYHDSSGLYLHEMANPFVSGDDILGRESGATLTSPLTISTGQTEMATHGGQPNSARYVEAEVFGSLLRIKGRTTITGTGLASISGTALTLASGQRGLWQSGLWNGDIVVVDGLNYTIDTITSDLSAILTSSASVSNKPWSAPVPKKTYKLTMSDFGEVMVPELRSVSGLPGYDADPFVEWTYYRYVPETTPAIELEFNLPQTDTAASYSADEVVSLIKEANVPGLAVETVREVIYRHPDQLASASMTVASPTVNVPSALPSDDQASSLVGYYLIPEEGEHSGREFLILSDTPGSPRTLVMDSSATVTASVPAYRIEARKVKLASQTTSPSGQLTLGAGTAHSLLGLPSNTSLYGQFRTGSFKDGAAEVDLGDLGVIVGDDIQSLSGGFEMVEIESISVGSVSFSPSIPGNIQNHGIRIEGVCPTQWNTLSVLLADAVEEWYEAGMETLDSLGSKLSVIVGLASSSQPSDVADFRRELTSLRQVMERVQSALQSFVIPDIPAGREILEALNEQSLDRAKLLLTRGRFQEFFDMGSEEATSTGRVQQILGEVNSSLGTTNIQGELEADSEEPVAIIDFLEDDDDREGLAKGDQVQDNDDVFSVEDEEFSNGQ